MHFRLMLAMTFGFFAVGFSVAGVFTVFFMGRVKFASALSVRVLPFVAFTRSGKEKGGEENQRSFHVGGRDTPKRRSGKGKKNFGWSAGRRRVR